MFCVLVFVQRVLVTPLRLYRYNVVDPPGTTPEPPRNHHGTIRNHTGTIPEASSLLPSCFPLASLHVLHFFKENKQNREEAPLPGPLYSGPDNVLPPKGARITALQMWSFETICSKS
jgi:hypothetical protein